MWNQTLILKAGNTCQLTRFGFTGMDKSDFVLEYILPALQKLANLSGKVTPSGELVSIVTKQQS